MALQTKGNYITNERVTQRPPTGDQRTHRFGAALGIALALNYKLLKLERLRWDSWIGGTKRIGVYIYIYVYLSMRVCCSINTRDGVCCSDIGCWRGCRGVRVSAWVMGSCLCTCLMQEPKQTHCHAKHPSPSLTLHTKFVVCRSKSELACGYGKHSRSTDRSTNRPNPDALTWVSLPYTTVGR